MILSAQSIKKRLPGLITPFYERREVHHNGYPRLTYGLAPAGYDIRIAEEVVVLSKGFHLASSMERFQMPFNLLARVTDKSTWARLGIAVQNTVLEPGWRGHLTLELTNHSDHDIRILKGMPIAQVLFEMLDMTTEQPYAGKYQDQPAGPNPAK